MTTTTHQLLLDVRRKAAESGRQLAGQLTLSGACMALGLSRTPPAPQEAARLLRDWTARPSQARTTKPPGWADTLALREMRERLRPDFRSRAEGGTWTRLAAQTSERRG